MNNNSTSLPFTKVNLTLTSEAVDFLSETTSGTSHFAILGQLIKNMSVTPSSTTKRGNVIMLDVGQVECSIHSYCAKFGIGRKKFEAIMRKMEQHSIIRMHRSRLATVADLACITSWLLPDGSTMTNGIDGNPAVHSNGQSDNHDAPPMPAAMSMMVRRMPPPSSVVRVYHTQTVLQLLSHPSPLG